MSFDSEPASSISPQDGTTSKLEGQQPGQGGRPSPSASQLEKWAARYPEAYVVPVCGGTAGAVSGIVSCPLDVIKTKLQAQGGLQSKRNNIKLSTAAYHGIKGTTATIWKEEGLRECIED